VLLSLRKQVATEQNNPRIMKIHLHTFRHFKGTMEYHKNGGKLLEVRQILGHKDIESTLVYITLEQAIFNYDTDEWTCKIATTPEQATKLIETGFTLADTIDGKHLYKKRK
jgi:integrase